MAGIRMVRYRSKMHLLCCAASDHIACFIVILLCVFLTYCRGVFSAVVKSKSNRMDQNENKREVKPPH